MHEQIQRIPRYIMLLADLKRRTPAGHAYHEHLEKALEYAQDLGDELDRSKSFADKLNNELLRGIAS